MKKVTYYLILILIIACSFFHFSGLFYPYLNSDSAIHILMAKDLSFPKDFYFWGQDRLGSLIPLLGFIIIKLTGLSAVMAVSLAQFIVLFLGFLFISKLLDKLEIKLLLAVLWFLPPYIFTDSVIIAQPFGIQMSLFGIAIYLFSKIQEGIKGKIKKQSYLLILSVLLIITIWVSDAAIIGIMMIILLSLLSFFELSSSQKHIQIRKKNIFKEISFYHTGFWICAGYYFLKYAKSTAVADIRYSDQPFNKPEVILKEIWNSFDYLLKNFKITLNQDIFYGLFFWTSLIIITGLLIFSKRNNKITILNNWSLFFFIHGILALLAIYSSEWVYLNGMSRRYFVLPYISFSIAFVIYLDRKSLKPIILNTIIILLGLTSMLSSILHLNYPTKLNSRYKQVKEFKRLGEVGIIAEYWNSYVSAIAQPDLVIATPHDSANVRNPTMAEAVLKQPNIFLIKDMWLKEFPEVTVQFGHFLKKHNKPFQLGGASLCEYRLSELYMIFKPEDLQSKFGIHKNDIKSKYNHVLSAKPKDRENFIIFGPYTDLPPGSYSIKFHLSIGNFNTNQKIALIDVCSNWGQLKHSSSEIRGLDFLEENNYQAFELIFKSDQPIKKAEFRIYYFGNAELRFSHIELSQL